MSVSVCLSVCLCLCAIISSELHVRSTPFFVHGRGSELSWRRISGFIDDVIFARTLRMLEVAARLRQRGSHTAYLARTRA